MKLFSFPKSERLTHDSLINKLFQEGTAVSSKPIRLVYLMVEPLPGPSVKILVTVPKKKFKKAVVRNRLKRLMREAYRHNKPFLQVKLTYTLYIAFIYVGDKEDVKYEEIETALIGGLKKMFSALDL